MRALSLLTLLWLTACGEPDFIPREDFPEAAGDVICERLRECARGEFERDFFGMGDCIRHQARALREVDETFDNLGCSYDEEGAGRAWRNAAGMTCEAFHEGEYLEDYDKVWEC